MFESERRDLAWIGRWSIVRVNRRQSVAEHSYFVACYGLKIAEEINWPDGDRNSMNAKRLQLVEYLLRHDEDESLTGDIPGPVKRLMETKCSKIEPLARSRFGEFPVIDDEMKAIKKVADLIDECFYLAGEINSGNNFVRSSFANAENRLYAAILNLPTAEVLKHDLADDLKNRFLRELVTTKNYDGLAGI